MYAHTQQVYKEDCGLAVVVTLAKQFNKNISSLPAYIKEVGIYDKMLTLYDLKVLLKYFGIVSDAYEVETFEELAAQKFPIIVRTGSGEEAHYIVVYSFHQGMFTVSDPAEVDIIEMSYADLQQQFSNYALIVDSVTDQVDVQGANSQQEYLQNVVRESISTKQKILLYLVNTTVILSPLLITTDISFIVNPDVSGIISRIILIALLVVYGVTLFYNARLKLNVSNQVVGRLLSESFEAGLDDLDLDKSDNEISNYFWNIFNAGNGLVSKYFVYFDVAYIISLLIVVAIFNVKISLILLVGIVVSIVLLDKPIKQLVRNNKKLIENSGEWTDAFLTILRNKLDIFVSGKKTGAINFYSKKMASYFRSTEALTNTSTKITVTMNSIILTTIAISILITGNSSFSGIGGAAVYVMFMASEGFSELARDYIGYVSSKSEVEFITSRVAWNTAKNNLDTYENEIDTIGTTNLSIQVSEDCVIHYPNMIFEKGNAYLIVGENGVGKSTFVKILAGIYRGYEGKIKLNGKDDLHNLNMSGKVTYYSNELSVFDGTVAQNILLDNFEEKKAQIKIKKFGWNIDSNRWISRDNISSGQKQKVLLLRALHHPAADVYIFDEPLSNMDATSKSKFTNVIDKLKNNKKIVLVISHEKIKYDFDQVLNFKD